MMEFEQHPTEPNTIIVKMPKYYIAKHSDEDLQAAVLAEREACARLCDDWAKYGAPIADACAKSIRERGEK